MVLGSFLKGLKWLRTDLNRPRTGKEMNNSIVGKENNLRTTH